MFKIGITGSIGTGKTTIANLFALFRVPVFDADKEIKKILISEKVKQEIKNKWPHVVRRNKINKSKIKSIIFSNKYEKIRLEKSEEKLVPEVFEITIKILNFRHLLGRERY